jgi:hypothetical protein
VLPLRAHLLGLGGGPATCLQMDIEDTVVAQVKEVATRGEVRGGKTLANRLRADRNRDRPLAHPTPRVRGPPTCAHGGAAAIERVARLLDGFGTLWRALVSQEQREVLNLLIERIVVDLDAGGFQITFHEVRVAPPPVPTAAQRPEESS